MPQLDDQATGPRPASTPAPRRGAARHRSAAALLASSLLANVLGYALYIVINKTQGAVDVGVVTAILNLAVITAVPALAAQLVTARRAARLGRHASDSDLGGVARGAMRTGALLGLGGMLLLVLLSPVLTLLLRLDSLSPALVLAAMLPASSTTYAMLGHLQGRHEFGRYGVVTVVVNGLRVLAALAATWLGFGAQGLLVLTLAASYAGLAVAAFFVRRHLRSTTPTPTSTGGRSWVRESLAASASTAVVFVVSNVDVPLARQVLSEVAAGEYAVLSIFTKAAFWGSAFLATLFFPSMARGRSLHGVTVAALATAGIGVAATAAAAALADPLLALVGGGRYVHHADLVWLFTAIGSLWAVCQVIIYWGVATQHPAPRNLAWLVVVGVALGAWLAPTTQVVDVARILIAGGVALALGGLLVLLRARTTGRQAPPAQASPTVGPVML